MDVIVCHLNADFDCLSSMLGAKRIYPDATPAFPGSQEKKVREFLRVYSPLEIKKLRDIDLDEVTRLILVDTKKPSRIGPFGKLIGKPGIRIHVYDHHPHSEGDVEGEVHVVEDVGATATIFTEILKEKRIPISPLDATVLCLGIYEETGSLRFPSTTGRDLIAVAYLLRKGANLKIVSEYIKLELNRDELNILNKLLSSSRDIELYGIKIKVSKAVSDEYLGDVAHLAHRIMDMDEVDALLMLVAMDGKIVIVGRSRVPEVDVSEVLSDFGGGGHPVAASATIKDEPLEVVEERLIEKLKRSVKPQRIARDIMTSPVITIPSEKTLKEAESVMTKYGVNVLPVLKDGRYYGLLSREIVEKGKFHGFGRSRVSEFSTTDAEVTAPDTPISAVESLMIEQNQRFMPVIEDGRIIGAITRTDLLRSIYEETLRRNRITKEESTEKPSMGRNISKLLDEKFPGGITSFLRLGGRIADSLGYNAYLVGGTVRDLLRGEKNLDIDLVIEGDGIKFAKRVTEEIKGLKLTIHRRFNTAKIRFTKASEIKMPTPDFIVDVATARTEYYEEPASLPKVETSSIKKDLYRRDFTINTLAVKLNPRDFGVLIDFFGGQRDIRERTIRVLHNLSFIEDPTRAFRAVRFAERFGFKISKHTENLMKSALRLNLFERLSGTRIYDELALTFKETEPVRALKRLASYGLLKVIHPELKFSETLEETLQAIHEGIAWFDLLFLDENIDRSRLYIMGLLSYLEPEKRLAALRRLSTSEKNLKIITEGFNKAFSIVKKLKTDDPVEIYMTLRSVDLETMIFSIALCKDRTVQKAISRYLLELRETRPQLTGKDLIGLGIEPGPVYSKILAAILEKRLRGSIKNREDEIDFVKSILNKIDDV
ncbi:poly(A) polymerase I precursor [bacterium BMS3Bbin06]|nr:poly(A) polymerase I precursor [bacterium BMS3Abin08]GBE34599.1 poly(A) polymerase I precursor [bacterium BMS3Bbin06]HDO36871.1 CBS domain-containing protein [Nitrospirota bacterium]HDY70627.1 CBS domain-containing protein [Nitrospirota bacterium]